MNTTNLNEKSLETGANLSSFTKPLINRKCNFGHVFVFVCVTLILVVTTVFSVWFYSNRFTNKQGLRRDTTGLLFIPDYSVDPCDNFYEYACGGWHQKTQSKFYTLPLDSVAAAYHKFEAEIVQMLQEPEDKDDISGYQHAKIFYDKCLAFNSSANLEFLWDAIAPAILRSQTFTASIVNPPRILECADLRGNTGGCFWREGHTPETASGIPSLVQNIYKLSVGHKYLMRKFSGHKAAELVKIFSKVEKISENVQESYKIMLQKLLDPEFQTRILEELNRTKICVGFPSWILNRRVQEEYHTLPILHNSTLDNLSSQILKWQRKENAADLLNNSRFCHWKSFQGGFDAAHIVTLSQMYIKMGFLLPPYFTVHGSSAINYGLFGGLIGHELAHSVYKELSHTQWQATDGESFEKCLANQYGQFFVNSDNGDSIFVNERQTNQENFADNLGLRAAYHAYKLEFGDTRATADDQLFFLGFAQRYCESPKVEDIVDRIRTDNHSPGMFRVIGTLQNFEEFSAAWNCPTGSGMNPHSNLHRRCKLF